MLADAEAIENAHRVRSKVDRGADAAKRLRLLENGNRDTTSMQRYRRGHAADARSYDRDLPRSHAVHPALTTHRVPQ